VTNAAIYLRSANRAMEKLDTVPFAGFSSTTMRREAGRSVLITESWEERKFVLGVATKNILKFCKFITRIEIVLTIAWRTWNCFALTATA